MLKRGTLLGRSKGRIFALLGGLSTLRNVLCLLACLALSTRTRAEQRCFVSQQVPEHCWEFSEEEAVKGAKEAGIVGVDADEKTDA